MSWDDLYEDLDDFDYAYKLGIYEEDDETEEDPEYELLMNGLDPDDLEDMSEDRRREVIEDAGLDPDDYDDLFIYGSGGYSGGRTYNSGGYSGGCTHKSGVATKSRTQSAATRSQSPSTYTQSASTGSTSTGSASSSDGKWGLLEFIGVITIITIIGYAVAAIGGEFLGTIIVIIIGIAILLHK